MGCGYQPWELLSARLRDPNLTAYQVDEITADLFKMRSSSPLIVSGVFISYSHTDAAGLALKLYERLKRNGASCWLDQHDMVAGAMAAQVERALRLNDVVVLILSRASLQSDWVNYEITRARAKEKSEGREVLCPIAIDDSWKDAKIATAIDPILFNYLLQKYNVLDFTNWETDAFEGAFQKLWAGLKIFYPRN